MKTSGLFIVGIMAGGLLLGGCGAEKEDSRPAEIAEIREGKFLHDFLAPVYKE